VRISRGSFIKMECKFRCLGNGIPTSGPNAAHGGTQCAATILNGNYPVTADTRLTRLSYFTVPAANQNPRLRFWHWFSFSTADYGKYRLKFRERLTGLIFQDNMLIPGVQSGHMHQEIFLNTQENNPDCILLSCSRWLCLLR